LLNMDVRDYRGESLWSDGILSGLGISALAHIAVVFLAFLLLWMMPPGEAPTRLCTVDLLTIQDIGGGFAPGEEGAMGKAGRAPEPETSPAPAPEPEPERVEDAVPLTPVPKTVEKPKEKPKPKPARVRKEQTIAKAQTPPPIDPKTVADDAGPADNAPVNGQGEGTGIGNTEGPGKGASGNGPGSGPGTGSGAGGGPVDAAFGSGDGPRYLHKVLPRYPRFARQRGQEGTVLLLVTISERGRPVEVEVLKPAGMGFDEEAVRAVKESTFSPLKRDGRPMACRARLSVQFVLEKL
jgi:protein TonB